MEVNLPFDLVVLAILSQVGLVLCVRWVKSVSDFPYKSQCALYCISVYMCVM